MTNPYLIKKVVPDLEVVSDLLVLGSAKVLMVIASLSTRRGAWWD